MEKRQSLAEAKILQNGRITVPQEVREDLDANDGDYLIFEKVPEGIIVKKGIICPVTPA